MHRVMEGDLTAGSANYGMTWICGTPDASSKSGHICVVKGPMDTDDEYIIILMFGSNGEACSLANNAPTAARTNTRRGREGACGFFAGSIS